GACVLELHEPTRPLRQVVDDLRRPLRRDDLRGRRDRAAPVVHVVHRPFHDAGVYWPRWDVAIETKAPSRRSSHVRTSVAHRRPSSIAHTTSDCPRRASPAAKTPSTEVA